MLRHLVKKLKSQSLNEDELDIEDKEEGQQLPTSAANSDVGCPAHSKCKVARPDLCGPPSRPFLRSDARQRWQRDLDAFERDSGTESDEELERIETRSYQSVPSDYGTGSGSQISHSPTIASSNIQDDQQSNSANSMGGESGIGLRDIGTPTPSEAPSDGSSAPPPSAINSVGAFRPVHRRSSIVLIDGSSVIEGEEKMLTRAMFRQLEEAAERAISVFAGVDACKQQQLCQISHNTAGNNINNNDNTSTNNNNNNNTTKRMAGDKRKHPCNHNNTNNRQYEQLSMQHNFNCFQCITGGGMELWQRDTAKTTPVKLLIAPSQASQDTNGVNVVAPSQNTHMDTIRVSPRKKCRSIPPPNEGDSEDEPPATRPCLNFDKMRQTAMVNNDQWQHQRFMTRSACARLRAQDAECLFRPVDSPPQLLDTNNTGDNDADFL